jgi:hypothetical protein
MTTEKQQTPLQKLINTLLTLERLESSTVRMQGIREARKQAEALLPEEKQNGINWILLQDEIPPIHELVLTCDKNNKLTLSRYVSNDFPHSSEVSWAKINLPN